MTSATGMHIHHTYQATTALLHGAHQPGQTVHWAPRLAVNEM